MWWMVTACASDPPTVAEAAPPDLASWAAIFAADQGYTEASATATALVPEALQPADRDAVLQLRRGTLRPDPVCTRGTLQRGAAVFAYADPAQADRARVLQIEDGAARFVHQDGVLDAWCPSTGDTP